MIFDELLEFNTKNGGQFTTGILTYIQINQFQQH